MALIEGMDDSGCTNWTCPDGHLNCFTCRAIPGPTETCEKYQLTHDISSSANEEAMLLQVLAFKPCPKCGIFITSVGSCHNITCLLFHACWVFVHQCYVLPGIIWHYSYCFVCDWKASELTGYRNPAIGHGEGYTVKRIATQGKGKKLKEEVEDEDEE